MLSKTIVRIVCVLGEIWVFADDVNIELFTFTASTPIISMSFFGPCRNKLAPRSPRVTTTRLTPNSKSTLAPSSGLRTRLPAAAMPISMASASFGNVHVTALRPPAFIICPTNTVSIWSERGLGSKLRFAILTFVHLGTEVVS